MISLVMIVALSLSAQAGADKNKKEAPAEKAGEKTEEVFNVEVAPESDPFAYSYSPFGKRDPFRSYLADQKSKQTDTSNPLLNYDLSKFLLTGVVWGITNPRAIVLDGGGSGHIIARGTRIGRNRGRVVRILKDQVIVAEEFRDPLGKLIVSEYAMKLKEGNVK